MSKLAIYQPQDHSEFMSHKPDVRARAWRLFDAACLIACAPKNQKTAVCRQIAEANNVSFNSIYEPVRAYFKTKDWRVFIDRRSDSCLWNRKTSQGVPHDFAEYWRECVENNSRSLETAYEFILLRLAAWRRGDLNSSIPGYLTPPLNARHKHHPAGWSLRQLRRIGPKAVELAAVQEGKTAALAHAPVVFTTRKTGYPFQEIQFDDMWHDFNVLYGTQLVRILEFGCIDWYSAFYLPPVLKPRVREDGVNSGLSERHFRLYAVHLLATIGWSPRGTVLRGERGTAAFRNGLADRLRHWSNGLLSIPLPGMSGHPAIPGGHAERGKGNFHVKALKEGRGKLIHNYLAAVAGQTGMDRDHTPAGEFGRDRETLALAQLQGLTRGDFKYSHLTYEQGVKLIYHATDLINGRHNHNNEGWLEENLITQDLLVNEQQDIWMPAAGTDPAYLAHLAETSPHRLRTRRMSSTEVITPYFESNIKLTWEAVADCIYHDCRRLVTVDAARLSFQDKDYGHGMFRYPASYQRRDGFTHYLETGEQVYLAVNPFDTETGYIFSLKDQLLGRVRRDHAPVRSDVEALKREAGKQQSHLNNLTLGAQVRHGQKRASAMTHNARVLEDTIRHETLVSVGLAQPANSAPEYSMDDEYSSADLTPQPANIAEDSYGLV